MFLALTRTSGAALSSMCFLGFFRRPADCCMCRSSSPHVIPTVTHSKTRIFHAHSTVQLHSTPCCDPCHCADTHTHTHAHTHARTHTHVCTRLHARTLTRAHIHTSATVLLRWFRHSPLPRHMPLCRHTRRAVRPTPLLRVKAKITVKTAVCRSPRRQHTEFFTLDT